MYRTGASLFRLWLNIVLCDSVWLSLGMISAKICTKLQFVIKVHSQVCCGLMQTKAERISLTHKVRVKLCTGPRQLDRQCSASLNVDDD